MKVPKRNSPERRLEFKLKVASLIANPRLKLEEIARLTGISVRRVCQIGVELGLPGRRRSRRPPKQDPRPEEMQAGGGQGIEADERTSE